MAEINFIIPRKLEVIVAKLIAGTRVGNVLADGQHVYNLNCHVSTFKGYYKFGYFIAHERKIRMFYVDPLDGGVRNHEFRNCFDLNISF